MLNINQFDHFIGQKVLVKEEVSKITVASKEHEFTTHELEESDTVIEQLTKEVEAAGYHLRVWLPSTIGTMNYNPGRINVTVKKENDQYQIVSIGIG